MPINAKITDSQNGMNNIENNNTIEAKILSI